MARWEPGAHARLRDAALSLFLEQGFEGTTVAQIAERAGMNRRTFFHHFADKGEVVFAGQSESTGLAEAIAQQPHGTDALSAAVAGLQLVTGDRYESQRDLAVTLGRILTASPELQQRELAKRSTLAHKIAAALRDRGTSEDGALVTAWTAVAIFFGARDRWNTSGHLQTLNETMTEVADAFRTSVTGRAAAPTDRSASLRTDRDAMTTQWRNS